MRASLVCVATLLYALGAQAAPADQAAPPDQTAPTKPAPAAKPAVAAQSAAPAEQPAATQPPVAAAKPATGSAPDKQPEKPSLVGRAAPATAAGTTPSALQVRPGFEVFGQYAFRVTRDPVTGSSWYHDFDVPRVHAALDATAGHVHGRVLFEAVRSAGEGALVGVAGDSLVIRAREAYAQYSQFGFEVWGGLIPTLTIPELEGTWMLRAVAPVPQEIRGLLTPADIGGGVRYRLPLHYGWVGVAAYNGEGYTNRELNRGKSTEMALAVHPVPSGVVRPLAVFGSYMLGSSGTGSSRADRATGGLLWQGKMVRAGVDFSYGFGLRDDGTRRTWLADAFVRVEPVNRLILGARATRWVRDALASGDRIDTLVGTVGYRVAEPLEVYLAEERSAPTARARDALPASDYWETRVVARIVY